MMNFEILFLAALRDDIGLDKICISIKNKSVKVADVVNHLCQTNPACKTGFEQHSSWQVAVNKELVDINTILQTNDEIAFFPPFSGG